MKNATAPRKTKFSDIDQRWVAKLRRELRKVTCTRDHYPGGSTDFEYWGAMVKAYLELIEWGEMSVARAKKARGGR
tara:strand:- start:64 stop:291 length:228 start_codon:yes stop_codon:yes gene_type:complete